MVISDRELRDIEAGLVGSEDGEPRDAAHFIARYVEMNPHRPWVADARLAESGVPVWAIIAYMKAVDHDLTQVALDYDVPKEAVVAAVLFYARHKDAIDARITANDEPMAS